MNVLEPLSRRVFLQSAVAVSTLGALRTQARANSAARIEYAVSRDAICVLQGNAGGRQREVQTVPSQNPVFVALDRSGHFLFAVNQIDECDGLPKGSVESYAVDQHNGKISLISRRALSLSAINPRHLAIAPDGRHLVVAVYGGGAYNVVPVARTGEMGPVTQIIKEIGGGLHPEKQSAAHPHSVAFHPSGRFLFGTDFGADRLNVFRFDEGRMTRTQQISITGRSGPTDLIVDRTGSRILVRYELTALLCRYRFSEQTGIIAHPASSPI